MKFASPRGQRANTLILVLFFCVAIGMVLAATLKLIGGRYGITMRSTRWNEAIPVLEAGVEEALTHLHDDTSITDNGWTLATLSGTTTPVYTKQRHFSDGSYYSVSITTNAATPIIYSQGYVPSPYNSARYISRMVKVTTSKSTVVLGGINTQNTISANPTVNVKIFGFSGNKYYASNATATAVLATDSNAKPAITLNSKVTVDGNVDTGAGGTVSGGTVTGSTLSDMNMAFPVPTLPSTWPSTPSSVTSGTYPYGGTNYSYQLGNGNYASTKIQLSKPMVVTGDAAWYVNGDFTISLGGSVYIAPGASLTLYVNGSTTVSGTGIANGTGSVTNFVLNCLVTTPGGATLTISGNGDFVGTIDAPNADMSITGNGNFYGSATAYSFLMNGNGNIFLSSGSGGDILLVVGSWQEM